MLITGEFTFLHLIYVKLNVYVIRLHCISSLTFRKTTTISTLGVCYTYSVLFYEAQNGLDVCVSEVMKKRLFLA